MGKIEVETVGSVQVIGGVPITQMIDLTDHINIDDFDLVVRAINKVVSQSETLSLDRNKDRAVLIQRLLFALGAVVKGKATVKVE